MKRIACIAAIGLLTAGTVQAFSHPGPAPASSAPAVTTSVPLGYDKDGRPTAQVGINGRGPFTLVVDTGASGSGLNEALVAQLGLTPNGDGHAAIRGAGGVASVNLYALDSLSIGSLTVRPARAAGLPNGRISDAAGVLGADTFAAGRIEFDFAAARLNASASPGAAPMGFEALPVRLEHGALALLPVRIGGIETMALVDTGARATVGNPALMRALGYAEGDARLTVEDTPTGATGHIQRTWKGGRGDLGIGRQVLDHQALVFGDLPIFNLFGAADKPALILGIDSLRRFRAIAIDYRRSELQVLPRG